MGFSQEEMEEIDNTEYENDLNADFNDLEQSEIIGTNLKELIESEINADV
jgi:hypothetical protein